jgi:1-acyl-sn-glycerol-3-phosphate acyltransferase
MLGVLYRQAAWVLRLSVNIEGTDPDSAPRDRPLLVLCRHAGPGDSFLLVHALINWYDREPRIVLKDTLQWDPAIDVLLNRLPTRFIAPPRERGELTEAQIGTLATALDGDDAFVIFPEGANFTPKRWTRAIERLDRLGLHAMARRAKAMHNVLPPRPGGVLAALDAAPGADVVFVAHTGVDHLLTVADVWRELPMDKTITMQWWLEPAHAVPAGTDEQIEWLYGWWARIDTWIEHNRPVEAPWRGFTLTGER